ncbi:MAG TPA: SHOCT domain-containing protein [Acidimicrobiales bacterium]|nr:SHOCT domain-containing protein [Acidimicrobiales bacterium]
MYGWQYQDGPGGWGIFMMLMMVLFWGLLVWGIVASVRHYSNSRAGQLPGPGASASAGAALEALRLRYAKGEIDDEEFERRRANLDKGGSAS